MPAQSVDAADRMVKLPRPFLLNRFPATSADAAAGSGTGKSRFGAALSAARVQMRLCELAALPWPVAEMVELEALRRSAPAIRDNPRPPPARAADRPAPAVWFCVNGANPQLMMASFNDGPI